MLAHLSDNELILTYHRAPDPRCLALLYQRHAPKVYAKCLSMTKNPDHAQDLTHDVFLKVLGKLAHFQHKACFSTWLYSITLNHCIDHLRQQRRFQPLTSDTDLGAAAEPDQPDRLADWLALSYRRLSPAAQALLHQKYILGWSLSAIAQHQQTTLGAVKMRLKRTRQQAYALCQQLSRQAEG